MLLEACAQSERSWNPFRPPTADTVATVPPCVLGCLAELGEDADASLAAADVGSVLVELPAVVSAATAAARLGRKVATVLPRVDTLRSASLPPELTPPPNVGELHSSGVRGPRFSRSTTAAAVVLRDSPSASVPQDPSYPSSALLSEHSPLLIL